MNLQIGYANVIRVSETEFRNYTVADYDIPTGILDIVFHIHGNGVGSQFINNLSTGDELFISAARGKRMYDATAKQQLFFGDETSLGLACSFLPALKKNQHQFHFYLELDDENKTVPASLELENYTVFSKNGVFQHGNTTSDLTLLQPAEGHSSNLIITGNVKSMQHLRKVLRTSYKGKVFSHGYWLEGKRGL
jgi:NADPH-dependent ferric siderophore reductase